MRRSALIILVCITLYSVVVPIRVENVDTIFDSSRTRRQDFPLGATLIEYLHALYGVRIEEEEGTLSLRRYLAVGDFADFNQLFESAKIDLPDAEVSQKIAGITLTLKMKNLYCQNITIGDIELSHKKVSNQRLDFNVSIVDLTMNCFSEYDYDYGFLNGNGRIEAYSKGNYAQTSLAFTSTNFDTAPPTGADVAFCTSNLNIYNMEFRGGIVNWLLDTFQSLVRGVIESRVEAVICKEFSSLGTTFVEDAMAYVQQKISKFLQPLPSERTDPLYAENMLTVPDGINLLNYKDLDNTIGSWVSDLFGEADKMFGDPVEDPNSPTGTGRDLGINKFLRDNLLDPTDRSFAVNISSWNNEDFNPVLFESHDILTSTTITVESVKIFGLDTFTTFSPLNAIGRYTLRNTFQWRYLTIELHAKVEIKPSTSSDSILIDPDPTKRIVEYISISTGVDTVYVMASIMLVINQDILGALELGSLLNISNIFPCFVSTIFDMQLSGLNVLVGNIRDPVLAGFISPGIDRLVTEAVETIFVMYEPTFMKAIPAMFQLSVRDLLQKTLVGSSLFDPMLSECSTANNDPTGFVDFRDLFLAPDQARFMGGTGLEPYGNLFSFVYDIIQERFGKALTSGQPVPMNDILIRPWTKRQSGVEGMLQFSRAVFSILEENIKKDLFPTLNQFQFSLSDIRIRNLDTIVSPLALVTPVRGPSILSNDINVGRGGEGYPLSFTLRALLEVETGNSPMQLNDEIDVVLSVNSLDILAKILAEISADKMMSLPVQYVLDPSCWLDMIPAVALDESGQALEPFTESRSLSLRSFAPKLSTLSIETMCLSCTSPGTELLPQVLSVIKESGAISLLGSRLEALAESLMESEMIQTTFDRLLAEAHLNCPFSPSYNITATVKDYGLPRFTGLPSQTLDTVLYAGLLAAEAAVVVLVENHRVYNRSVANPLSAQDNLSAPDKVRLIDWTDLGGIFGLGSLTTSVLDDVRSFLTGKDDSGEIRINALLGQLLDESGKLSFRFDDIDVKANNFVLALNGLRISGITSLTKFDVFKPISQQTLLNEISIASVSVELDFSVNFASTPDPPQVITSTFIFNDINASVALLAAFDIDKLGSLSIGSLLQSTEIIPCIMTTLFSLDIPVLNVTIGGIPDPIIEGLLPNTSSLIAKSVGDVMLAYGNNIIAAIPTIFDTTVKEVLVGFLRWYIDKSVCSDLTEENRSVLFVDFRDMFSGSDAYGDLIPRIKDLIENNLLSVDSETGKSKVNRILLDGLTEKQSGTKGAISMSSTLFDLNTTMFQRFGVDRFLLQGSTARLENLNTVEAPVLIAEPISTNGYLLDNNVTLGAQPNPLHLSFRTLLAFSGDPYLSSRNDLNVSFFLDEPNILMTILAKIYYTKMMNSPLRNVARLDCWLANFLVPTLDTNAVSLPTSDFGLAVDAFQIQMKAIRFSVNCSTTVGCSSAGFLELPHLLKLLQIQGIDFLLEERLTRLAVELVKSESMQKLLNSYITESSVRCTSPSGGARYIDLTVPTLSRDSLDSIAFIGACAVEIGIIVVAKSHVLYNNDVVDPLAPQKSFDLLDEMGIINFLDLNSTIGPKAELILNQVREYVSDLTADSSGQVDLGINIVMRSFLLDDNDLLVIKLDNAAFKGSGMEIALKGLRIVGLDSFNSISILDVIGAQTVRNQFTLKKLQIELDLTIGSDRQAITLTVALHLKDISLDMSFFLAIAQDYMGSIEMGQLLDTSKILTCLLSSTRMAEITDLDLQVGVIERFFVVGFENTELSSAAASLEALLLNNYGDLIASSVRPIFRRTVKTILNHIMLSYVDGKDASGCPKASFEMVRDGFVDFRDLLLSEEASILLGGKGGSPYGNLFRTILEIINNNILKVDPKTGLSNMNTAILDRLTERQSNITGTLLFPGDLINKGTRINVGGLDAKIQFQAYDAYIANLDTVGDPLSILNPVKNEESLLNNTACIGVGNPLILGSKFLIGIKGDTTEIRNNLDVSLDLRSVSVFLSALLEISEMRLLTFPLRAIPQADCWISMVPAPPLDERGVRLEGYQPSIAMKSLAATVAKLNMNITCIECTSPGMVKLTSLLSTREAKEGSTKVANDILNYVGSLLAGEYLQVTLDRMLHKASLTCPYSAMYDSSFTSATYEPFQIPDQKESIGFFVMVGIAGGGLLISVFTLVVLVKVIVRRRHKKWLSTVSDDRLVFIWRRQRKEAEKEAFLNSTTRSLFNSPVVPYWFRTAMPFIICGNIALFLSGHLSLGGTVNIQAKLAEQEFVVNDFYTFSVLRSTIEIWNAGGKELAILIMIFSGIWPYTKQLITLALWFLPPKSVSISKRGNIFLWLDALTKWSIIDVFTLIIMLAGFRISVQSPSVPFLPEDFYSLDLLVIPKWGLYANMTAQLVSQISSHFIIHYHRRVEHDACARFDYEEQGEGLPVEHENLEENNPKQSIICLSSTSNESKDKLKEHTFVRPHRAMTDKLVARRFVSPSILIMAFILSVLVVLGCSLPSFSLEVLGIVGVLVESGQRFKQARKEYSVFNIVSLLFAQAKFTGKVTDYIGLGSLSALLIFSVLLVPIVQTCTLLGQWFIPMTKKQRYRLAVFVEMCQAWQYAEVYLLALLVAAWQLGPVSEFMINSYCNDLKETFAKLVFYGVLNESDAQCFRVDSRIESASYVLVGAAFLLALINSFITKAVGQYFRDKDNDENRIFFQATDSDLAEDVHTTEFRKTITPVPVLFSDTFRWFLRSENISMSRHQLSSLERCYKTELTMNANCSTDEEEEGIIPNTSDQQSINETGIDMVTMAGTGESSGPYQNIDR